MSDEVKSDPPQALEQESGPRLCPNGHKVRSKFGGKMCSGISCGKDRADKIKAERVALGALVKVAERDRPYDDRRRLAKLPEGLKGDEATKWAQEKLIELLPEAVASVAFDLRYGTDKQRETATDRVLKANGLDRRDAPSATQGGLIVLNLGQGPQAEKVPWLQRMTNAVLPSPATVAATEGGDDE